MPRRTAAERHLHSAPQDQDPSEDLAALLIAFHHPVRRWLTELLSVEGPANVGQLAARTGLAVGSVSHHLKVLHQRGLIEPAPELAHDTRESWWRLKPRSMTWSVEDFEEGTLGRRVPRRPRRRTSGSRCAQCRTGCGGPRQRRPVGGPLRTRWTPMCGPPRTRCVTSRNVSPSL